MLKNFKAIQGKISEVCKLSSRDLGGVKLLAVSKKQPDEKIEQAIHLGQKDFGENYVQELLARFEKFPLSRVNWHFIGNLQRNKCKYIVGKVALIHSVDRLELAKEISKVAVNLNVVQDILIQVNLAGEEGKGGAAPDALPDLISAIKDLNGVRVKGLMCLPPLYEDPELVRPHFRHLKGLANLVEGNCELSMGTSHDFDVAIEEGATILRIGTSLFGPRE